MTARKLRLIAAVAALVLTASAGDAARAATLEISGPAGALVTVDGRSVGFLPLAGPLDVGPGRHVIMSEMPGHVKFEHVVYIGAEGDHAHVTVRLLPLRKRTAWTGSLLFAGMGQFYLGHETRGWIYAGTEAAGLLAAAVGELRRSNLRHDYLVIRDDYSRAINADEAVKLREQMEAKYDDMESAEKLRDTGLLVAAAAVVVSAVDAFVSFPDIEAGPGPVPVQTDYGAGPAAGPDLAWLHAGVKVGF